jgi:hypothetical protein
MHGATRLPLKSLCQSTLNSHRRLSERDLERLTHELGQDSINTSSGLPITVPNCQDALAWTLQKYAEVCCSTLLHNFFSDAASCQLAMLSLASAAARDETVAY